MVEPTSFLGLAGVIYNLGKDLIGRFRPIKISPQERVERRAKWRPIVEDWFLAAHRDGLKTDAIIRDIARVDDYPNVDEHPRSRKISPWFRVGLMGKYESGIYAGLQWVQLTRSDLGGWRFPDRSAGEDGEQRAMLIGRIPYENIVDIVWHGDEYYNKPIIYCIFSYKGEPYRDVGYYEERDLDGYRYFTELASAKTIAEQSHAAGIKRLW